MPSGELPHYQPCLLVCGFIIVHALCCGASLSAMAVGVVPPCRTCLLVGCLTIVHACWYGTLLSAMTVGVVPHCRSCLLACCHCNGHIASRVQTRSRVRASPASVVVIFEQDTFILAEYWSNPENLSLFN